MLTSLLLLVVVEAAIPADLPAIEANPAHMDAKALKAFNASLPAKHPLRIRCSRETETGSLIRAARVCKTNQQWSQEEKVGNDDARDSVERSSSKSASGQ